MIISFMTFIVSTVGLIGYGINSLLKKENLPSVTFTFPVFKILFILIASSFVIFVGSMFTFGGMALLAADDEPNDAELTEKSVGKDETDNSEKIDEQAKKDAAYEEKTKREEAESDAKEQQTKDTEKKQTKDPPNKDKLKKESQRKSKKLSELKVHFIDVGQADAALVQFQDKAILIDAGNWNQNEVVGYLRQVGIDKLDIVIGSHEHADHIGQIDKVINNFPVEEVWLPGNGATSQVFERVVNAIDTKGIGYDEPRAGDSYKIGDAKIDIISPSSLTGNVNNDSIVVKLTYGAISFLFTGDAEREAESRIVNSGQNIAATVLKVGHHGSDTSTTDNFLNKVNPKIAVISVGQNSQYEHPSQSVIDRLHKKGVDLYATKSHGNIVITTDGNKYTVTTEKSGKVTAGSSKTASSGKGSSTKQSEKVTNSSSKKSPSPSGCVDINTASATELENIIHIGPARAQSIIDARPFKTVDDLTKVNGIAKGRLADIKAEGIACVK